MLQLASGKLRGANQLFNVSNFFQVSIEIFLRIMMEGQSFYSGGTTLVAPIAYFSASVLTTAERFVTLKFSHNFRFTASLDRRQRSIARSARNKMARKTR